MATSRICGCAAGAVRSLKKCRHSRRLAVITTSVLRLVGRTARASCGVQPQSSSSKYDFSAILQATFQYCQPGVPSVRKEGRMTVISLPKASLE